MHRCSMLEIKALESLCTWRQCNLFKKLDRFVANLLWMSEFSDVTCCHLSKTLSYHNPLLISLKKRSVRYVKEF